MDPVRTTEGRSPSRYLLRDAGGYLWLLDTWQAGVPYVPPIQMNETGARIWSLRAEGKSPGEIAEAIGREEGIPLEEILPDVECFLKDINSRLAPEE